MLKTLLVGYIPTDYVEYHTESRKLIETRDVRFVERYVYGDTLQGDSVPNEELEINRIDPEVSISQASLANEGVDRQAESSESEGKPQEPPAEGKRGRPQKSQLEPIVLFASLEGEENTEFDQESYALLAKIIHDPQNYREAMSRPDNAKWRDEVNSELEALNTNDVYKIVDRPKLDSKGCKRNILDIRWIFKTKVDLNGKTIKKASIAVRRFKDSYFDDLRETYAPVTRVFLIRAVLAFANKDDLTMYQLDVKTAFLNSTVLEEIYVEILDDMLFTDSEKKLKVCKLEKSLYGLKTSPKRWNELFTETMIELGFTTNEVDPCLFVFVNGKIIILAVLYVDDIIMTGNDVKLLNEYKNKLQAKFSMKDFALGEPNEYLGITIIRDRSSKSLKLNQTKFR